MISLIFRNSDVHIDRGKFTKCISKAHGENRSELSLQNNAFGLNEQFRQLLPLLCNNLYRKTKPTSNWHEGQSNVLLPVNRQPDERLSHDEGQQWEI
jgi:hypothetical protein